MNNFMNNRTILSIIDVETNKSIFNTDSAPAIPNIGEIITVAIDGSDKDYIVENRKFVYEKETDTNIRTTYVFVYVKSID